jgi:hypothetical protein
VQTRLSAASQQVRARELCRCVTAHSPATAPAAHTSANCQCLLIARSRTGTSARGPKRNPTTTHSINKEARNRRQLASDTRIKPLFVVLAVSHKKGTTTAMPDLQAPNLNATTTAHVDTGTDATFRRYLACFDNGGDLANGDVDTLTAELKRTREALMQSLSRSSPQTIPATLNHNRDNTQVSAAAAAAGVSPVSAKSRTVATEDSIARHAHVRSIAGPSSVAAARRSYVQPGTEHLCDVDAYTRDSTTNFKYEDLEVYHDRRAHPFSTYTDFLTNTRRG